MAKSKIINLNDSPAIEIDGKIYPPMTATVTTSMVCFGSTERNLDREYYRNLGKSGIKIFYVMCNNVSLDENSVEDFAKEARVILEEIPDAYIMVRMTLIPSREWIEQNPDETVSYSDGKVIPTIIRSESRYVEANAMPSLCSEKWRKDMGEYMLETINQIRKLPFADRICGYFLGAGGTSEWYYINPIEDFSDGSYGDLSKAFREEFTKYLDKKYGKGKVSPQIPDCSSRFYTSEVDWIIAHPQRVLAGQKAPTPPSYGKNIGSFLDIDKEMHTFDFYRAWHEGTANSVIHFAKLIKENYPDTLVGAFYGSMGGSEIVWASNGAGVMKILESGYVDFLANPGVYENRQPGGHTGQRVANDSFNLHGSLYVVEDDVRTHAENRYFGEFVEMFDVEDTVNVLKRDFGRDICNDTQGWWFDQHPGGGRYKFPEVYDLFARQQGIGHLAYSLDRKKENEIAFIYDEESVHTVSRQTTDECVQQIRNYEIANIGAPSDSYYHNDMASDLMPDYKLYVFCNCFYLSDKEREDIKRKLSKNNATALFLYGNGIMNPDAENKFGEENIYDLTGIKFSIINDNHSPMFRMTEGSHPIAENFDSRQILGAFLKQKKGSVGFIPLADAKSYLFPVIYPDDENAKVIATYAQTGLPAVSVKENEGYTSVYCGSKYISSDFLREVARFAGCHIFDDDGHVLYGNKNFITFHAAKSGNVTLKFKEECTPFELYEEKEYGKCTKEISFYAKCGDTKMFWLK